MPKFTFLRVSVLLLAAGATAWLLPAGFAADAAQLSQLETNVFQGDQAKGLSQMLYQDFKTRRDLVHQRDRQAWQAVQNRADWEKFKQPRIQALRSTLCQWPAVPKDLKLQVTGKLEGEGYRIENLVFESRPGLVVTANLYLPQTPSQSMPGIIIVHSHHNPKTQAELQDMGMTWARLGCMVLVPDQIDHGERRQHPFKDAQSYPGTFRVGRQDYYFRYHVANQLYLIGDSLMGWMAWDNMRCVDVLLSRPGIDRERIIMLGAVAGGGDPCGVTAALDERIAAAAPFNFGGPQPETRYPLPDDAETSFNYLGGGSWESTRNLAFSGRDGFLHWVIVGSLAPRGLIYGHEFSWDRERDPVWARFERIWGFYNARDRLAFAHGRGLLQQKPPEATHCNNIGPAHRKPMYPTLQAWFKIPVPDQEYQQRRPSEELMCLTPAAIDRLKPRAVYELAAELGAERSAAARKRLESLPPAQRRQQLRQDWARLLGDVEPKAAPKATAQKTEKAGDVLVERLALEVEPGIVVPLVLLEPVAKGKGKRPVVVGFAQQGKQEMLGKRAEVIADLLAGGAAVCLADLRGTGETRLGDSRTRTSASTSISASELMLGQTLLGSRLRDLRSVLRYLRTRPELDAGRLALWGDSFAPVNPPDRNLQVPADADKMPDQAEPLGGLLALLGGLFEDDVKAVYGQGGLAGYQTALQSQFWYLPHDVIVPGALTVGDLSDVAGALAPRPLRLDGLVDGLNRRVPADQANQLFQPARAAYQSAKAADRLQLAADGKVAAWLLAGLQ